MRDPLRFFLTCFLEWHAKHTDRNLWSLKDQTSTSTCSSGWAWALPHPFLPPRFNILKTSFGTLLIMCHQFLEILFKHILQVSFYRNNLSTSAPTFSTTNLTTPSRALTGFQCVKEGTWTNYLWINFTRPIIHQSLMFLRPHIPCQNQASSYCLLGHTINLIFTRQGLYTMIRKKMKDQIWLSENSLFSITVARKTLVWALFCNNNLTLLTFQNNQKPFSRNLMSLHPITYTMEF